MSTLSLYGKTAGLRRVLLHAALFGAVTTVGFVGMLTIDRPERMSTIAYSTCGGECSHGPQGQAELSAVSSDHLVDSGSDGRFQQILRLLHLSPDGALGDDMAAILRE
jgi:hypothetical protein